jgi:hypothetical protein
MDMDQSAIFLAGSILTILGFVVIAIGVIVINNIASKYWKPVTIFTRESFSLFGHHSSQTPINPLNDEEYEELVKHLETIRSAKEQEKKKK